MGKNKPFKPGQGLILAVHNSMFFATLLGEKLGLSPYAVARGLEEAGLTLELDIFDLSADTARLILAKEKEQGQNNA